jgi:ribonuclease HI
VGKNGWTAFGSEFNPPGPVANQDLWEAIDALARKTNGTQIHPIAKGSHPENVECDRLAKEAARKALHSAAKRSSHTSRHF